MNELAFVASHLLRCPFCRRAVDSEEVVVNEDDLPVHVECGTIVEELAHELPAGSAQTYDGQVEKGVDAAWLSGHGVDAAWLSEQAAFLAALPTAGSKAEADGQAFLLAAMGNASSQARARQQRGQEAGQDQAPLVLPPSVADSA